MKLRDQSSLHDILRAFQEASGFVKGYTDESFYKDRMCQAAVVRQIEIIGEAVKRLSMEIRDTYPDIPWKKMAGMRDVLIHAYDTIDIETVWETISQTLPPIMQQLEKRLKEIA